MTEDLDSFRHALAVERAKQITAFCRSLPLFPESVKSAKIIFRFDDGSKAISKITGIEQVPLETPKKPTQAQQIINFAKRHQLLVGGSIGIFIDVIMLCLRAMTR